MVSSEHKAEIQVRTVLIRSIAVLMYFTEDSIFEKKNVLSSTRTSRSMAIPHC